MKKLFLILALLPALASGQVMPGRSNVPFLNFSSGFQLCAPATNNFIANCTINTRDSLTNYNTISGGGTTLAPNQIGALGPPHYADFTPTGWTPDLGYVAGVANYAIIGGSYDNIVNQEAGAILAGAHNFVKSNAGDHSIIAGGAYNVISAGRSGIFAGRRSTITGAGSNFNFIGVGDDLNIVGSFSVIPGGLSNSVNGDYSLAFGRRAKTNSNGSITLSDSTDADFTNAVNDSMAFRFVGGYLFTGNSGLTVQKGANAVIASRGNYRVASSGGSVYWQFGLDPSGNYVFDRRQGGDLEVLRINLADGTYVLQGNPYVTGVKAMPDNAATGIFEVALPASGMTGGEIRYTYTATGGGEFQAHSGVVSFAAVNKAGVYTTAIGESTLLSGLEQAALSAGTLTDVWSIVAGVNKITVTANFDTSLAVAGSINYTVILNDSAHAITKL